MISVPKKSSDTRKFCLEWKKQFSWLVLNELEGRAYCSLCTSAFIDLKLVRRAGIANERVYDSFVKDGFCTWNKAIERFRSHEKSNLHLSAVTAVSMHKKTNVSDMLSTQLRNEKADARICLMKIFESIRFLAVQGIPSRSHKEQNSNFIQLLHLRSLDQPLLKDWMSRTKYKWISHDIGNEILTLMAMAVRRKLLSAIRKQPFYAIMADETTDVSRKEQMSLNFRYVDESLVVHESFLGFYETPSTDSETLFKIVLDALLRFEIDIRKCRGQCYDGAFNMSGEITGLQTRIRELVLRAYYVHCAGHNLNLVAQDAMKLIDEIASLSVMRDLITFVRASAKRVHIFKEIQSQLSEDDEAEEETISLKTFCPTRWTVRVKSLKSVKANYSNIMKFCEIVGREKNDCGVKARGFTEYLSKFDTYILLQIAISTLEKVETLNETIQATTINFRSVLRRLELLKTSFNESRTDEKFHELFETTSTASNVLKLNSPQLPRRRIAPKRFDAKVDTYDFHATPEDKYRAIYFHVIDQITSSLNERFDSKTYEILSKLEDFALNKCCFDDIEEFVVEYHDGKRECDFDVERLVLHRSMFFDVIKSDKNIDGLTKVSIYLQEHNDVRELLPEYVKFIRFLLTSPQTVVVAEQSFSTLKRLKTYMQSTTKQQRTNDLAILHVHRTLSNEIDLNVILDEFISKNALRQNTFALST